MKARLISFYERYLALSIILALPVGIMLAKYIPTVMNAADKIVSFSIEGICLLAPVAIFIILAPNVAKMMRSREESSFAGLVIGWFSFSRIMAGIWAAIFTTFILGLPIFPKDSAFTFGKLFHENLIVLRDLLLKSPFFWAIWASIIVGIIAYYKKGLFSGLEKVTSGIEKLGEWIEPVIPLLMCLLGAYIYSLPKTLNGSLSKEVVSSLNNSGLGNLNILGFHLSMNGEFGLVWIYLAGSVLIGIGCFIWQGMQILLLKTYVRNPFFIRGFFKNYWVKVYPLAWSTSSEALSMPLNMSLIKKKYPHISSSVRKLVVGLGAYLNINGTTMHVILLAGIVSCLVGHEFSLFQLLLSIPIVALIGFGVPGIPGELVFFAIPMMKILNPPEPIIPLFMALYLALQIGLPDSFRTGANVTDNGLYAIALNKLYHNRWLKKKN